MFSNNLEALKMFIVREDSLTAPSRQALFELFIVPKYLRLLKPITMDISMDMKDIKKLNKLVTKHRLAYSLGLETDVENKYNPLSEKYLAFEHGRYVRNNRTERRKKTA